MVSDEFRRSLEELRDSFLFPYSGDLVTELSGAYETADWGHDDLEAIGRGISGFVGAIPCRFWSPPRDNRQRRGSDYVWFDEHEYLIMNAASCPLPSAQVPKKLQGGVYEIPDGRVTFGKEGKLEVDARVKILFPWADKNLKSDDRPVEVYTDIPVPDELMSHLLNQLVERLLQGKPVLERRY